MHTLILESMVVLGLAVTYPVLVRALRDRAPDSKGQFSGASNAEQTNTYVLNPHLTRTALLIGLLALVDVAYQGRDLGSVVTGSIIIICVQRILFAYALAHPGRAAWTAGSKTLYARVSLTATLVLVGLAVGKIL